MNLINLMRDSGVVGIEEVYTSQYPINPVGIALDYPYLYILSEKMTNNLVVYNISTSEFIASYPFGSSQYSQGIVVYNGKLYICSAAVSVYNITDPLNVTFEHMISGDNWVDYLFADTNTADRLYTVHSSSGELYTVNTVSKSITNTLIVDKYIRAFAQNGNILCVVNNDHMYTIDVTNPDSPTILGNYEYTGADFRGVAISGDVAFCTSYDQDELVSIDISTPANPTLIQKFYDTGFNGAGAIVIDGATAYVAGTAYNYLTSVDISTPSNMTINYKNHKNLWRCYEFIKYGTTLISCTNNGINVDGRFGIMTVTSTTSSLNEYYTDEHYTGNVVGISPTYSSIYVTAERTSMSEPHLVELDISDVSSPTVVGTIELADAFNVSSSSGLRVGNYLYVLYTDYFCVIDVTTSGSPVLKSSTAISSSYDGKLTLHDSNTLLYVRGDSIKKIDITNPLSLVFSTLISASSSLEGVRMIDTDGILIYNYSGVDNVQLYIYQNTENSSLFQFDVAYTAKYGVSLYGDSRLICCLSDGSVIKEAVLNIADMHNVSIESINTIDEATYYTTDNGVLYKQTDSNVEAFTISGNSLTPLNSTEETGLNIEKTMFSPDNFFSVVDESLKIYSR